MTDPTNKIHDDVASAKDDKVLLTGDELLLAKIVKKDSEEKEKIEKEETEKATTSKEIRNKKDEEKIPCKYCKVEMARKDISAHAKAEHMSIMKEMSKIKRTKTKSKPVTSSEDETKKDKGRYYLSKVLPEKHQLYIKTLTTFFALRYSFTDSRQDFKISIQDKYWNEFGDIVIEFSNKQETSEIRVIQCKQIQNRSSITVSTLEAETGKFSMKTCCEVLKNLRNKKNYDKTYFVLYTLSELLISKDNFPKVIYDDAVLNTWKVKKDQELWKNRQIIIPHYEKNFLLNTTDDSDDVCIFKIVNHNDNTLYKDLNKFCMLTHQKKLADLQILIKLTIEDRFANCHDISSDITNFMNEYFNITDKLEKHYKLTMKDFLLKLAELLLTPFIVLPETLSKTDNIKFWNDTIQDFDVVIIKNHTSVVQNVFTPLNHIMKQHTDYSNNYPEITVEKDKIKNEALKSELFDGFEIKSREISWSHLYLSLWKKELAPLVLSAENKENCTHIIKVISFLKEKNIPLKFIIATDLKIDHDILPEDLNVFLNLNDLKEKNVKTLENILNTDIRILNFSMPLKEIVKYNEDFLETLTPHALLNILLEDYSFDDVYAPVIDDMVDNSVIVTNHVMDKIKKYFQQKYETEIKELTYVINIKGKPTSIVIPPEL